MSGASREMGRWRGRLNTFFLPRAALTSNSPPIDLRLPDWYVAAMCAFWVLQLAPLLLLIIWAFVVLPRAGDSGQWFVLFALLVMLPCHLAAVIVAISAGRRFRRQVGRISGQGRVPCLSCHYSLEGLEPQGACPECGRLYDLADVAESWRRLRAVLRIEAPGSAGDAGVRTPPDAPPAAGDRSADR